MDAMDSNDEQDEDVFIDQRITELIESSTVEDDKREARVAYCLRRLLTSSGTI